MRQQEIIEKIKSVGRTTLPPDSTLLLYGSRARGDARKNSDWDLLILLDKNKLTAEDYDLTYPLRQMGWEIGEEINPHIYTKHQWRQWSFLPYYKNVEHDKIVLL